MGEARRSVSWIIMLTCVLLLVAYFLPAYGNSSYWNRTYDGLGSVPEHVSSNVHNLIHIGLLLIALVAGWMEMSRNGKPSMYYIFAGLTGLFWFWGVTRFEDLNALVNWGDLRVGYYMTFACIFLFIIGAATSKSAD